MSLFFPQQFEQKSMHYTWQNTVIFKLLISSYIQFIFKKTTHHVDGNKLWSEFLYITVKGHWFVLQEALEI